MCRTLNSDIVTQSNALSNQLSTHDIDIKSTITSSQDTITNAINAKGCIKKVQRGCGQYAIPVSPTSSSDKYTKSGSMKIPIATCNPDKSVLLMICDNNEAYNHVGIGTDYVKWELSNDGIILYGCHRFSESYMDSYLRTSVIWQVVEFY